MTTRKVFLEVGSLGSTVWAIRTWVKAAIVGDPASECGARYIEGSCCLPPCHVPPSYCLYSQHELLLLQIKTATCRVHNTNSMTAGGTTAAAATASPHSTGICGSQTTPAHALQQPQHTSAMPFLPFMSLFIPLIFHLPYLLPLWQLMLCNLFFLYNTP